MMIKMDNGFELEINVGADVFYGYNGKEPSKYFAWSDLSDSDQQKFTDFERQLTGSFDSVTDGQLN